MPGTLSVWLNDLRVGELTNIPGDYNIFAFCDEYRADPMRPVLSQSLVDALGEPIVRIPRTHTLAPPFFSNLLPEPDTLLRQLLARQHRIKINPDFGFLKALGGDLPGAVRVLDEGGEVESAEYVDAPAPVALVLRHSLAGVQLKFSAGMRGDRLTIPASGGSWIIKLPTNTYQRLPENEYAMMQFAREVGLNVPRTDLVPLSEVGNLPEGLPALRDGEPPIAYVIARFDRPHGKPRLHFEDLNQIAGQFPRDKDEKRSLDYVARVVNELCSRTDVEELISRIIFGIAIANNDMHLKNWAITYPEPDVVQLAPLYDFVCTKVYFPNSTSLILSLGGEKEYSKISEDTLSTFADQAGISSRMTRRVAKETVDRIRTAWSTFKNTLQDETLVRVIHRHMDSVPLLALR